MAILVALLIFIVAVVVIVFWQASNENKAAEEAKKHEWYTPKMEEAYKVAKQKADLEEFILDRRFKRGLFDIVNFRVEFNSAAKIIYYAVNSGMITEQEYKERIVKVFDDLAIKYPDAIFCIVHYEEARKKHIIKVWDELSAHIKRVVPNTNYFDPSSYLDGTIKYLKNITVKFLAQEATYEM